MTNEQQLTSDISKALNEILEKISDRNSGLTQLAKARLQIMETICGMAFNDGNDRNGNWAKLRELKEEAQKIDELIRVVANTKQ
jgi:hypothetical protein